MSKLWPQSLFAQLMLTLLLVLTSAQLISVAILFYERERTLIEVLGLQSVERINAVVQLLNDLPSSMREKAIDVFSTSELRISLDIEPIPESAQSNDQLHTLIFGISDQRRPARVQIFDNRAESIADDSFMMRESKDSKDCCLTMKKGSNKTQKNMCKMMQDTPSMQKNMCAMMQDSGGMQRMMREMMGGSDILTKPFLIQFQLDDGSWVSFMQPLPEKLFNLPHRILASLLIIVLTVSILSLIVVRRITKPISALAVAADELGRDIQRPPLDENGPREVNQAARAFNVMQSRLNQYIKDRSHMLASISHDLKTPITRLRLRAELLKDKELEKKFLNDLDDMQMMVKETLDYMRGQDSAEPAQKIDINALIESLVQDMQDAGYEINFNRENQKIFYGRLLALKRCLSNLLENAIRYGDKAVVYVEESDNKIVIRIIDNGPGIPKEQLEQIFEPFFRLEPSRNRSSGGVGLGLGIARDIARANGGDIYLRNRKEGGLEAILELPNSSN